MLRRLKFRCNAEFARATVVLICKKADGFVLDITADEVTCRYLVNADGAHSVVMRDVFDIVPEMLPMNNITHEEGGYHTPLHNQLRIPRVLPLEVPVQARDGVRGLAQGSATPREESVD